MLFYQREFFGRRDEHGVGTGGGKAMAVLAGMVYVEAVGIVLDRADTCYRLREHCASCEPRQHA